MSFVSLTSSAIMGLDSPQVTWRNRTLSSLTVDELDEGIEFCQIAYNECKHWAPAHVWALFSTVLADMTIERAKRGV